MASNNCRQFLANLTRAKKIPMNGEIRESQLRQKLNTFDLTLLGIGSMVGSGLYVVAGVVAKDTAGPAIVVSYLFAGVVALLAAMCYAEFAGKIHLTGSAYTFTYVALGEVWAFFIGWNMVLEYVVSSASVGRGISGYVDNICDNAISNFTIKHIMGGQLWQAPNIAQYPDLLAVAIEIFTGVFVLLGVSVSSWVNKIFISINMLVVLLIFGLGIRFADFSNWTDGFAPYGIDGVIAGAATAFYAFVGFDTIAICNEEATNPKRSIPVSTFIAVLVAIIMNVMATVSLTLMIPYSDIDVNAAFPSALAHHGVVWARWAVVFGAISGMFTVLLGSILPMSRCVYAIANDGLLFPFLARINARTGAPVYATVVPLLLTILLTLFFSMDQLVHVLSVGTLSSFAFVSGALIVIRYRPTASDLETTASELTQYGATADEARDETENTTKDIPDGDQDVYSHDDRQRLTHRPNSQMGHLTSNIAGTLKERYRNVPIIKHLDRAPPGRCVVISLVISVTFQVCALAIVQYGTKNLAAGDWWAILILVFFIVAALLSFLVIPMHHQETTSKEYFSVSFV